MLSPDVSIVLPLQLISFTHLIRNRADGLRAQDLVYMLLISDPGDCINKVACVNEKSIGTQFHTAATVTIGKAPKMRQPGTYTIGIIPYTAPDYQGRPSRFLHGMPYRVAGVPLQNPAHDAAIQQRYVSANSDINLPTLFAPVIVGNTSPSSAHHGIRSNSGQRKQLERHIAYLAKKLPPRINTAIHSGAPLVPPGLPARLQTRDRDPSADPQSGRPTKTQKPARAGPVKISFPGTAVNPAEADSTRPAVPAQPPASAPNTGDNAATTSRGSILARLHYPECVSSLPTVFCYIFLRSCAR
jgi:hypothetical protein